MPGLRCTSDADIALRRLSHLECQLDVPFSVVFRGEEPTVRSFLTGVIERIPFKAQLNELKINLESDPCPLSINWHGMSDKDTIWLFPACYGSVTSLFFTFFHEYAHILKYNISGINVGDDEEIWADGFAWFCIHPEYLRVSQPTTYEFWSNSMSRGTV